MPSMEGPACTPAGSAGAAVAAGAGDGEEALAAVAAKTVEPKTRVDARTISASSRERFLNIEVSSPDRGATGAGARRDRRRMTREKLANEGQRYPRWRVES